MFIGFLSPAILSLVGTDGLIYVDLSMGFSVIISFLKLKRDENYKY